MLETLANLLEAFLRNNLPKCSRDWWQATVVDKLTFQQQALARNLKPGSLDKLDLSALLRVFDQNWYELSLRCEIDKSARNWLKEAQNIRNRWAHAPAEGIDVETKYRDVDTVDRLLKAMGCSIESLSALQEQKTQLLATLSGKHIAPKSLQVAPSASDGFKTGDMVRLRAQPSTIGAVIGFLPGSTENRYQIFHDGAVATYYESQVELATSASTRAAVTPSQLHAALSALQLRHPSTKNLYSLFASRINFVPYQFRPVLKLIQADRPRLLIADEVGVGKTIEAGLILKELQSRREIRSVLVICPKPLVSERKWQQELKRFDEQFEHLDGASLRYCVEETHLDGIWPNRYSRAILPYSLLDESLLMGNQEGRQKQRGLLDLDTPPAFDLVIVDEAHHIRNTDTWAYRNVRYFCDNAEAVVLLSATPIQLADNDLFNLLHLLRPDIISSRSAFEQMAEPNPHLNVAIDAARGAKTGWRDVVRSSMTRANSTAWGRNVLATDARTQYAHDLLDANEEQTSSRLALIRYLEELYTFSTIINRTRRRDIGNFTIRKPETVAVQYTPEQDALHTDLVDLIARMLSVRHGDQNLQFMLSTLRRQVASCVFGLAPLLESTLNRHLSQVELSDLGDDDTPSEIGDILSDFRTEVESLIVRSRSLTGPDPKYGAFLKVIHDKQRLPNNKLLVFSSFRHTLDYLVKKLSYESIRIGLIHGDVSDEDRRELRNRFSLSREEPGALDILLSSEVGCEGLDYQFCDALVNYDLPWNPMRVEQRIGRIDRYGQKSETVVIYNFITPGTVDSEIYERCLMRIGVFRQALGGSEEILGRLTREIREIAENFSLSSEEQAARLQQISDNEIRVIQEQAKLEEEQTKLFGLSLPRPDEEMINHAASFWLDPSMLINLVTRYLESRGASNLPASLGQKPVVTLQLGQEIRERLLIDYQNIKLSGSVDQSWFRWLSGNDPYLPLTFDQATADERRELIFVTPNHPLIRQAAHTNEPKRDLVCNLRTSTKLQPAGRYPYAIYRWRKIGIRDDFTFQPVCVSPQLTTAMLKIMESANPLTDIVSEIQTDEEHLLEQTHYKLWLDARADHIEQIEQTSRIRLASLDTTHAARVSQLQEQRDDATDARISRMRNSQIEAATRDYDRRSDELINVPKRADILAERVALGILVVEENE